MLRHVFAFELRYHLRSALFWLGGALFFLIVFGAVTSDFVQVGGAIGNVNRNSPFVVLTFLGFVSVAGVFVSTAFVAGAILRDYDLRTHEILFTTRITRPAYVWGRFLGAYAAAILLTSVVLPAIPLLSLKAMLDATAISPTSAATTITTAAPRTTWNRCFLKNLMAFLLLKRLKRSSASPPPSELMTQGSR